MATYSATLTYYPGNGDPSWSETLTTENASSPYVTFSLPTLSWTGYTFNGWSYNGSIRTGSITLYATWDGASYSVSGSWTQNPTTYDIGCHITWDNNGGTPSSFTSNPRDTASATAGASLGTSTPLITPTKTGHTFNGWNIGGTLYGTGIPVSVWCDTSFPSYTYTASWTADTYSVTIPFDPDGGSPTPSSISASYSYPDTYATITMPSTVPIKSGYTFAGWGTQLYQPGQSYSFTGGTYTLVAQWTLTPTPFPTPTVYENGWKTLKATIWNETTQEWEDYGSDIY